MKEYLRIVEKILNYGYCKKTRTGIDALSISGEKFEYDMKDGFPLLTTKKMAFKSIKVELKGFIKGITDKKWYQDNGCRIWDEWCNRKKVPYAHDEETKKRMLEERDLGPIYGFQWRHFGAEYYNYDSDYTEKGKDQLEDVVGILKKDPISRRMVVSAWDPVNENKMAMPPCHYSFHVLANPINMPEKKGRIDLIWNQRSVDTMLGLPFNIASYGILLHLLAKESGFEEGKLIGFLGDVHIYKNHIDQAVEQLKREPFSLPTIVTEDFKSIFEWEHKDTKVKEYKSHPKINYEIAV